ncbi:hypothetical protein E5D57_002393 [Metarhizium anisopliae]|nr:hypothetical protein E5D57_002393 [Metarhizium anisopliae]
MMGCGRSSRTLLICRVALSTHQIKARKEHTTRLALFIPHHSTPHTVVDHISLPISDLDEVKCTYSNIGVFNGARDDTRRRMPMPTLFQSMANGGYLAPNRWDVAFWSTGERPSETSMARAHAGQLAAI